MLDQVSKIPWALPSPIRHGSQVGSVTASLAGSVVAGMAPEARATQQMQWGCLQLQHGTPVQIVGWFFF